MNEFTIVCIFKDEEPYLAEWIEYHRLQGFERFVLFDNGSADQSAWVARNHGAEVIPWPGPRKQLPAYHHALVHELTVGDWAAFIDVDEYLWCPDGKTVVQQIYDRYMWQPALLIPWLMFGSSGHLKRPRGLTIDNYVLREEGTNPHTKTMLRVGPISYTEETRPRFLDPHHTNIKGDQTEPYIFCNHYWTRSFEECKAKFARGRADFDVKRTMAEFYDTEQALAAVQDNRLSAMWSEDLTNVLHGARQ